MTTLVDFIERYPSSDEVSNPLILIPTFNNGHYLRNCLRQLDGLGLTRYLILDGGSTEENTVSYLQELESAGRVISLPDNPGPRYFFENQAFYEHLPQVFCVTDPDLEFNSELPKDFLSCLNSLTEEKKVGKAGFALSLDDAIFDQRFFFGKRFMTIREWEAQFWKEPTASSLGVEVYLARIDTTFALYNKKYLKSGKFFEGVRVAGNYTARHLPWYPEDPVGRTASSGLEAGKHSTWNAELSRQNERKALEYAWRKIEEMEGSFSWRVTAPLRQLHSLSMAVKRVIKKIVGKSRKGKHPPLAARGRIVGNAS